MAKKKTAEVIEVVAETLPEAVIMEEVTVETGEAVVETVEVKSPVEESSPNLKLANLSPKAVPAMKPYDKRTVQVTTRTAETMHFNKLITRKDFK